MRLGVKQQILMAVILVVLILAGFIFLLELPKLRELGNLNKQREQKEKEIKTAETTVARLETLLKELPEMEVRLEEINVKMPAEPGLSTLIREIQRVSDEAGVEFFSIKPSAPSSKGQYSELPMEIVVNGYFFDVVDFLYRLYALPREVKITGVKIDEGEEKLPHLKVTVQVSAFTTGQVSQPQVGKDKKSESSEKEKSEGSGGTTSGTQKAP